MVTSVVRTVTQPTPEPLNFRALQSSPVLNFSLKEPKQAILRDESSHQTSLSTGWGDEAQTRTALSCTETQPELIRGLAEATMLPQGRQHGSWWFTRSSEDGTILCCMSEERKYTQFPTTRRITVCRVLVMRAPTFVVPLFKT